MVQSMPQARNRDGLGPILVRPIIHTWILRTVVSITPEASLIC